MSMNGQTAISDTPKQTKLIVTLVIVFGLFHCASLLFAILPADFKINQLFEPYRRLTGTEQKWGMFETIPVALDKEIVVEVREATGKVTSLGPILPGLGEFEIQSRIRHYPALVRMMSPGSDYLQGYLENLESAVVEEVGAQAVEFSVRSETDMIRTIKKIEEDGKMTVRQGDVLGPFQIGGED